MLDRNMDRAKAFPVGASIRIEDLHRDPYPVFEVLRRDEPVTWLAALDMWYVTRFADVERILHDPETFTTASPHSLIFDTFGAHMLTVEGALHDRYKTACRGPFTIKNARQEGGERIGKLVDALIDGFAADGTADLRTALASRLPVQVILSVFGLPLSAEADLRRWYDAFEAALANFTWQAEVRARARRAVAEFHAFVDQSMDSAGEGGLLHGLTGAPAGDRLSDDEIRRNASIIFFGGISTVEALILNSLHALFEHPDVLARVRSEPALLPRAVDEVMRWLSPVQSATRHVTRDVTLGGVTFGAGETVNCMLGAANRDATVFPDPDRFDIDRANARRHLGFAAGSHHCLGSHLARAEAQIALHRLLARLPGLRPDPERPAAVEGFEFRQPRAMHVLWDAAGAQG